MPRTQLTAVELQELHDLADHWGKIIARRTGDDALTLDFAVMEQLAQAAAAGLVEGTLQCLLQRQADALAHEQACPACGRPCPLGYEDRTFIRKGVHDLVPAKRISHHPSVHTFSAEQGGGPEGSGRPNGKTPLFSGCFARMLP